MNIFRSHKNNTRSTTHSSSNTGLLHTIGTAITPGQHEDSYSKLRRPLKIDECPSEDEIAQFIRQNNAIEGEVSPFQELILRSLNSTDRK